MSGKNIYIIFPFYHPNINIKFILSLEKVKKKKTYFNTKKKKLLKAYYLFYVAAIKYNFISKKTPHTRHLCITFTTLYKKKKQEKKRKLSSHQQQLYINIFCMLCTSMYLILILYYYYYYTFYNKFIIRDGCNERMFRIIFIEQK